MMRKIKTDKPIIVLSNVALLYDKMIGTREGIFAYDENFRLGFERMLFKATERDYMQFKIEMVVKIIKEYKEMGYSKYDENEIEIELIDKILEILEGSENNR